MITDAYVQVGPGLVDDDTCTLPDVTADGILAAVTAAGVDRVVLAPGNWGPSWVDPTFERSNALIAEVASAHQSTCVALGRVDPRHGADAVAGAERCFTDYGCVGLTLRPATDGFHLANHGLIEPLLAVAGEHGGFVVLHLGSFHHPSTQPIHAFGLAERFPDVPLILGHVGNRVSTDAIMVAERCANVSLLTCGMPSLALRNLVDQFDGGKLVFASDAPYGVPEFEVERVRSIDGLTDETSSQLLDGTIDAILSRRAAV